MTLCVILYDWVAPRKAVPFYNQHAEIVLELILIVLWGASFAGMASYVSQMSVLVGLVTGESELLGSPALSTKTKTSENCCIVIAILGAVMLYVIHLLLFLSNSRNIRRNHLLTPCIGKLILTHPNSVLSLANFMSHIVNAVQRAKTADIRPPEDEENAGAEVAMASSIGTEGK